MDRETFEQRLLVATQRLMEFTPRFVINELPPACRYLISRQPEEPQRNRASGTSFPVVSWPGILADHGYVGPLGAGDVVEYLWQGGVIPEWVNMYPHSVDGEYTYIEVMYCKRSTNRDDYLYHEDEGIPPFHVLGPSLPPGWRNSQSKPRFDLHWQLRRPPAEAE